MHLVCLYRGMWSLPDFNTSELQSVRTYFHPVRDEYKWVAVCTNVMSTQLEFPLYFDLLGLVHQDLFSSLVQIKILITVIQLVNTFVFRTWRKFHRWPLKNLSIFEPRNTWGFTDVLAVCIDFLVMGELLLSKLRWNTAVNVLACEQRKVTTVSFIGN